MVKTFFVIPFLSVVAVCTFGSGDLASLASQERCNQVHDEWVGQALKKMEKVEPGTTREDLLKIFTTESGLSTRLHRTFVSKDCAYFKVDVEFRAADGAPLDEAGRLTMKEDPQDIVVKISRPYLQFSISD